MMCTGVSVPYTRVYEQYGAAFILQLANLFSFCLTLFGLLAVAMTALVGTLSLIKKQPTQPNITYIGLALAGLGGYFIITTLYYYLTGGYAADPIV
jgi:hypothetical protein